ncbi:MAG: PKD domain-containing protein [Solirubrobacteraceae bacterium]
MRRAAIAPLLLFVLLPCAAAGAAQTSSAVNPRVAHPLGRLLGAIPVGGVSLGLHARSVPRGDAGPQPPPPNSPATCPPGAGAAPFALCTFGGSVLHSNSVYTIFWAPPGLSFPPGYINRVNAYFAGQAADSGTRGNVYSTDTQYYDSSGNAGYQSSFAGTIGDASAFPLLSCVQPTFQCISDADLTNELDRVIAANGWPRGLGPTYFVFLPQGASVCANVNGASQCAYQTFCAYHSAYSLGGGPPTLYSVEAYAAVAGCDTGQSPNATSADAVINTASHEHNEVITDPLGDGWLDLHGLENGDKCASAYGPPLGGSAGAQFNQAIGGGNYYLQEEFSNFSIQPSGSPDNGCAQSLPARPPTADFAVATNPPFVGAPVTFNATVSDPDSTVSSISWDFGDGTAQGSGSSVTHVYSGSGPHTVTLGVVDALGLRTQVSHPIQVLLPAPQAAFTAAPNPARAGRPVRFDGSASTEPGGAITAWAWSFGDGTQASGPLVSHIFRGAGPRTVTLLVSDSFGTSSSTAHRIDVAHGLLTSFGVVRGQTVRSVLRRGLRVRVRCSRRCRVSARVVLGAVHRRKHVRRGGVVLVRLSGSAARALRKRRGRLTLTVAVAAGSQRDSASRLVRLRL